jgi:EmrB/QacA subfamily drug resistance transporter
MQSSEILNNGENELAATNAAIPPEISASSTQPAQPAVQPTNKWVVLVIVALGVFMATIDSSIVNISLPTIAAYFGVPLSGAVEWVIIAYLVIIAAVLLTIGRLADLLGQKPIWAAGLAIFTLGSATCGLAPSLGALVAARAFQGLGGALLFAVSPAMLTGAFPAKERGRALGLNALVVALGVSVGPTLGGVITQTLSWRWIFYVNVPIGIVAFTATLLALKENRPSGRGRFDPLGAALLAIGLASLTAGLSFGQEWGWTSPLLLGDLALALVALVLLFIVELHVKDPVIDLRLFKNRLFASANVSLVLSFLALFAVGFMLPFYFEELRGFSTLQAGLLLTPQTLSIAAIAPLSGMLADRIGTRWLASIGLALCCAGLVLISFLTPSSSIGDIIWRLSLTGVGQAMFQSPNNSALMGSAPRERQGIASGLLATGRVVGQSLSVAIAGAIFVTLGGSTAGRILASQPNLPPDQVAALQSTFISGFQVAFLVCAGIAAIGVATSLTRGRA